jgi:hypothetical protein
MAVPVYRDITVAAASNAVTLLSLVSERRIHAEASSEPGAMNPTARSSPLWLSKRQLQPNGATWRLRQRVAVQLIELDVRQHACHAQFGLLPEFHQKGLAGSVVARALLQSLCESL